MFCFGSLRSDVGSFKTGAIAGQVLDESKRSLESDGSHVKLVFLRFLTGSGLVWFLTWSSLDSLKYWYFRCLLSELHLNSLVSMPVFSIQEVFKKKKSNGHLLLGHCAGKQEACFSKSDFIKSGNPKWKEDCEAYWGSGGTREILKVFVLLA